MKSQAVIALDLGGTKLAAALIAADGRRLAKRSVPLEARAGDAVGHLIIHQIRGTSYAKVMLGLLAASSVLVYMVCSLFAAGPLR